MAVVVVLGVVALMLVGWRLGRVGDGGGRMMGRGLGGVHRDSFLFLW
jgi:hypothetical protein